MDARTPIPLQPVQVSIESEEFQSLLGWPYPDRPFYEGQVLRVLRKDIRQLVLNYQCRIWVYHDPAGNVVGFGSLAICDYHARFLGGRSHLYIPVLGVHPAFYRRGHGPRIVDHLTSEAAILVRCIPDLPDVLLLDLYQANQPAVGLYRDKFHFVVLNPDRPEPDPGENNELYFVMAKSLAVAPNPAPVSPPPPSP